MTERRGGSDVSNGTETVALPDDDDEVGVSHKLFGYKWFSSATDSDISFTLARINNQDKLSMFFLRTRNEDGHLNGIQVCTMYVKLFQVPNKCRIRKLIPIININITIKNVLYKGNYFDGFSYIYFSSIIIHYFLGESTLCAHCPGCQNEEQVRNKTITHS